ncbi:hypothetical protein DBT_1959 [Dissulfuribacter thermophilus]|uniref:Uncharacterized protein n=1 Tax=Dissulfuribacter thermophilus TaxID=1156395 RepID=A0A1B9F495_9BACT|nr:hypothetical protein [Dissulfuribacter thermophilus]OCC14644.1 hypothetical protein DBT_1959 [Dissulfuribacter thermophilus]
MQGKNWRLATKILQLWDNATNTCYEHRTPSKSLVRSSKELPTVYFLYTPYFADISIKGMIP